MKLTSCFLFALGCHLGSTGRLAAADGDLVLEVVARTLDPAQLDWEDIPLSFVGGFYPVGIHEDGGITFVAERTIDNDTITGRYKVSLSGNLETLAESGQPLSGVSFGNSGNQSSLVPLNATATSPSGRFHAIAMKAEEQNQGFLYLFEQGSPFGAPIFWTSNLTLPGEGSFLHSLPVLDGRGEDRNEFYGGGVPTMLVTDQGAVIWENTGGLFTSIFRAGSASGVKAVVYDATPAPGILSDRDATFTARNKLIGVDDAENAYFFAEVQTTGGRIPVVYRQGATDDSLTPLFVSGQTPLPNPDGGAPSTATIALDDCAVTGDGTLYLRAPLGSITTGFWKIALPGVATPLGLFSEFTEVTTNQGTIRFRNIDDADWAVLDGDQIAFSSDIRSGASGTNEEGVWILDPNLGVVLTLVRAPLGGSFGS